MIDLLLLVPESVGWALVGSLATICCLLAIKLIRTLIEMWKSYHETEVEEVSE